MAWTLTQAASVAHAPVITRDNTSCAEFFPGVVPRQISSSKDLLQKTCGLCKCGVVSLKRPECEFRDNRGWRILRQFFNLLGASPRGSLQPSYIWA
ncbi:hypothetical protein J6590_027049 [Homalodisca vitripennis]|nr:hypothetical protein J6590_027049 [Homalodisca vitripennis]